MARRLVYSSLLIVAALICAEASLSRYIESEAKYAAAQAIRFPSPWRSSQSSAFAAEYYDQPFKTLWYTQTLDHFNFQTQPQTWQQRYLINDTFWDAENDGPIFFYTGNEGDITSFFYATGLLTDVLAPMFNALIIFAEHRYYGESLPYGAQSYDLDKIGYLTSEQALADYAALITSLKQELPAPNSPVIVFGGSYGGMLSSWFRMKYPYIVDGALAASAPILQFEGTGVSQYIANEIVTDDFTAANPVCSEIVRLGLNQILDIGNSQSGLQQLTEEFSLCYPLENNNDLQNFLGWLETAYYYLAMVDYPYPANFIQPLPGWPVQASCAAMGNSTADSDILPALLAGIAVYYNYTGEAGACYNTSVTADASLGVAGWDYQACTEMVMPMGTNGVTDMFPPAPWNLTQLVQYCQETYGGATPRADWVPLFYGGANISTSSNIIFSNGLLDPWHGGGVLTQINPTLIPILIEDAAHHLDLRAPNPLDPPSVTQARKEEASIIQGWLEEFRSARQ